MFVCVLMKHETVDGSEVDAGRATEKRTEVSAVMTKRATKQLERRTEAQGADRNEL